MGAPDVLARLSTLGLRLTREGEAIRVAPRSALTDEARALIRTHKAELLAALASDVLADPAMEARRQRVVAMLAERPGIRCAVLVDDPNADPVLVTIGIRGTATFELAIPVTKFNAFLLLDLIERHFGTVH